MEVKIVGSGGAFDKVSTGFLLDKHILIDCGESIVNKLVESKEIDNITDLFITHMHQDHVGGLEKLIYYKLIMNNFQDIDFRVHCNIDVFEYYKTLAVSKDPFENGEYYEPFTFNIFNDDLFPMNFVEFEKYEIHQFEVVHMKGAIPSYGYIVAFNDRRPGVIFTGDMDNVHSEIDKINLSKNTMFHDMGWTGIPISDRKFHPTEKEVFEKYGKTDNIIGVHTEKELKYYRRAKAGDIFEF